MASDLSPPSCLAPLQLVMLRDSLLAPGAGHHVEQVEIVLVRDVGSEEIVEAWKDTVAATEALRVCFDFVGSEPTGSHFVTSFPDVEFQEALPTCWEAWREEDRCRPLLFPDTVPWRVACWPLERRLVWTFHHALLDGRSIARVVRVFLGCLGNKPVETLPLSRWRVPSQEEVALAGEIFRKMPVMVATPLPREPSAEGPAVRCLGNEFLIDLEVSAAELGTTVASLVTGAWGRALADRSGVDAVLVEQVRAGAPQPGCGGFTMNVLPLVIRGSGTGGLAEFLADLGALRGIESVSAFDFPGGGYPDVDGPEVSTIMVEHETLDHAAGDPVLTVSVALHERTGKATSATAHLRPELRLEVEGPQRHALLDAWIAELERGIHPA